MNASPMAALDANPFQQARLWFRWPVPQNYFKPTRHSTLPLAHPHVFCLGSLSPRVLPFFITPRVCLFPVILEGDFMGLMTSASSWNHPPLWVLSLRVCRTSTTFFWLSAVKLVHSPAFFLVGIKDSTCEEYFGMEWVWVDYGLKPATSPSFSLFQH